MAKWDSSGLSEGIKKLIANSTKPVSELVNQRLLNVAGRAANLTPMASREKILGQLGAVGQKISLSKKGKWKRGGKIYAHGRKDAPLAALIVNARRGKAHKKGLYGSAMSNVLRRMIGGKTRSVGFERSGWFPGIRELARQLPGAFIIAQMKGISIKGKPKGEASTAKPGLSPRATIENRVRGILKYGSTPLSQAMDEEGREILRHLAEKMAQPAATFNQGQKP